MKFYRLESTNREGGEKEQVSFSPDKEKLEKIIERASKYEAFWCDNWTKPEWDFLPYPQYRHCYLDIIEDEMEFDFSALQKLIKEKNEEKRSDIPLQG